MDMLVDIERSPELVIASFRELHEDFLNFCTLRPDKLEVSTINIVKFIVLCYDKESPVVDSGKKRWGDKKREAAEQSDLFINKEFIPDAEAILYGKNLEVNRIIVRYLSLQFDSDFMMYVMLQEMLLNSTTQLMTFNFDKPSDAAKAKANVDEILKDLREYEEKIFSGGDVKELTKALYENAKKFTVSDLRPENVLSRREKGEPVVDEAPYGDGYIPEEQRFLDDH